MTKFLLFDTLARLYMHMGQVFDTRDGKDVWCGNRTDIPLADMRLTLQTPYEKL